MIAGLALLVTAGTVHAESWRFVSMPDFLNVDTEYPQKGWEESLTCILESVKSETPDFLVVPGDLVMGHWHNGDKSRPGLDGIEYYADIYYPAWKARLAAHGIKWYAALGDHELGDNPWRYKGALERVAAYKREFREHLGMPLNGPDHMKGTAFWWRHKNVLFVSVDVFEQGKSNQGAIRTGVTGKQLEWLNAVFEQNRDATHRIVMGHAPCLGPVRKWSSSGLMVEEGRESPFWQCLKANDVDLYLCGEVHAITCTERDGVQQIAHGGLIGYNERTNYLVVDVHPDRLELAIKEIDMIPSGKPLWQPGNNRPLEKVTITPAMKRRGFVPVGKLTINKAGEDKSFHNPQGYFLKKYETSEERARPGFKGGTPLPRINLDGTIGTAVSCASDKGNGLAIYIGSDVKTMVELSETERYLVHALCDDRERVSSLRRELASKDLYGPVSVQHWDGGRLPYASDLVNKLVVDSGSVSNLEVMRVLVPNGTAKVRRKGSWIQKVKPRPRSMDDWTHYLHNGSGNPVAQDDLVHSPRQVRWVGAPRWARHHEHMASMNALVSAAGKLFYICDEGPRVSMLHPPKWKLSARDAYNGLLLWQRDMGEWFPHLYPLKSGPATMPRRLVADQKHLFATLSIDGPVSVIDNGTGETVREIAGTEKTREIVLADGILLLARGDVGETSVTAADPASGRVLWDKKLPVAALTLAANAKQAVFLSGGELVALAPRTGERLWSAAVASLKSSSPKQAGSPEWISKSPPRLILHEDVVLLGLFKSVFAFSIIDGKPLWNTPSPVSGYASPRDLFVIDNLAWWGDTAGAKKSGRFWGRDLLSGEIKAEFDPQDESIVWLSHHRCHISKATCNYILPARMGIEFVDLEKQAWQENHWVRGGCLYGAMPANGLLYAPPHACACYFEAKLNGFNALTSATDKGEIIPAVKRLEKGLAFDAPLPDAGERGEDWPMFRGDPSRSGSSPTTIGSDMEPRWRCELGPGLTQPVMRDGRVFVATRDNHTLWALDAESGKRLWRFTAGGRIDSPPAIHRGRAVFGCRNGWVYCLAADSGKLAWRYRAVPYESLVMAYGQLESAWPVSGSVLIVNDEVHCVAGRNMFLDGGLRYLRIDLATGNAVSEVVMDRTDPIKGGTIQKYDSWLDMTTTLPDVLSCDGRNVYMRSLPFDLQGNRRRVTHIAGETEPAHLFSPTGYLDDAWFHRSYWTYGRTFPGGWIGHLNPGRYNPSGRLLVMDDENVYGYGRKPDYYRWTTALEYRLFAVDRKAHETRDIYAYDKFKNDQLTKFPEMKIDKHMELPSGNKPAVVPRYDTVWEHAGPAILVRAMAASKAKLFLAGPEDVSDEGSFSFVDARRHVWDLQVLTDVAAKSDLAEQAAIWDGESGASLLVVSKKDGKTLSRHTLDSLPVFDGLIVAGGQVIVATTEGSVVCLGESVDDSGRARADYE